MFFDIDKNPIPAVKFNQGLDFEGDTSATHTQMQSITPVILFLDPHLFLWR
jgi:hypothetical protein